MLGQCAVVAEEVVELLQVMKLTKTRFCRRQVTITRLADSSVFCLASVPYFQKRRSDIEYRGIQVMTGGE